MSSEYFVFNFLDIAIKDSLISVVDDFYFIFISIYSQKQYLIFSFHIYLSMMSLSLMPISSSKQEIEASHSCLACQTFLSLSLMKYDRFGSDIFRPFLTHCHNSKLLLSSSSSSSPYNVSHPNHKQV